MTRSLAMDRTGRLFATFRNELPMNISKHEQRVLHTLAQGGEIRHLRDGRRIVGVECFTRDGHLLVGVSVDLFRRLRNRGLIMSRGGLPYRISAKGLGAVRAQVNNR